MNYNKTSKRIWLHCEKGMELKTSLIVENCVHKSRTSGGLHRKFVLLETDSNSTNFA